MAIINKTSSYRFKLMTQAYDKWLKKGERALDIGCGIGSITEILKNYYSLKIEGCDIKNYMTCKGIPFKKISKGRLPEYQKKFDTAFLNDVLHHIPKEKQTDLLEQALKVARKVIIFEIKPSFSANIFDTILNKVHYKDLFTPLSFRDVRGWESVFKSLKAKSKYQVIRKPFWYPFSHIAFLIQKS